MSIKVLITGVLGFIGRSLAEEIINRNLNIEIHGIDIKEITDENKNFVSQINYKHLDIRDESAVKAYFEKHCFDGIVHLAAVSRVVDAENDKARCIETNYKGTKFILAGAKNNPEVWFIFGSSREVYGEQKVFPVNEDAEKLPLNLYGFYKLEGERIVQQHANKYFILRFSNVYGNKYDIPNRVVPKFVRQALDGDQLVLEGGGQEIDFTYIDDTVDSIIHCMDLLVNGTVKKEILHILPGVRNKITDIFDILKELGYSIDVKVNKPRSYDVEKFIGDPTKQINLLGKKEFTNLKDGINEMLKNWGY